MANRTFTIIKPNAVSKGRQGKILDMILENGFVIRAMKMVCFSRNDATKFYAIHKGRPFFAELLEFMTAGPSIVAILEKENAVADFRKLVGNTDPAKAEEGTIRRLYGDTLTCNTIHASDSDENARIEWSQFFTESEVMDAEYTFVPTE